MLEKIKPYEFDQVFSMMEHSFPVDEYRSYEEQKALLSEQNTRQNYSIYVLHAPDQKTIQAFLAVWQWKDLAFIEHFAVDPALRSQGIGSFVLKEAKRRFSQRLCLEVELPETELAKRRIAFYERNGFYVNEYAYVQPPLSKGKRELPLLLMTSRGKISQEEFETVKGQLYREVYGKARQKKDLTIIGAAIVDVLARPVSPEVFRTGSQPVEEARLSFGGDALNEAVVLARFGKQVELVSKVGNDDAGRQVLAFLKNAGVSVDCIQTEDGLQTGTNIVLVDQSGERYFLTNPKGSLRRLARQDVEPYLEDAADIVCFAGMFVSPLLDIPAMEQIFCKIKSKPGRVLAADMTKAKNGERLEDLKKLLPYIDYLFPNEEEIALLTGETDPKENARRLVQAGVGCAVIKCGGRGCLVQAGDVSYQIPAYPVQEAVDSTGAGDCFAAGFLWGLSEGMGLQECGRFACAAASCAVEQLGATAGICSLDEPMRRFQR
ncbi:MAG: GNAT family N-acetyltransferase [Eubacterium sp.]|nr:GNAT family N-acetyltransferase [Eubacterium sp.]